MNEHWEDKLMSALISAFCWPLVIIERFKPSFAVTLLLIPLAFLLMLVTLPIISPIACVGLLIGLVVATARDISGG